MVEDKKQLLQQLLELSNTDVRKCMQCGRCSGACPAAMMMDVLPHRMVWELAMGNPEVVLATKSPFSCLSCGACVQRCPRGVAPGAIMEAARLMHIRQQGGEYLHPDMLTEIDPEMPQQLLVAAFRKFVK